MREIVIDPEDIVCEIYVMGTDLYIEQSMKIPVDAIISVSDTPYARLRITVSGDERVTDNGDRRVLNEEI